MVLGQGPWHSGNSDIYHDNPNCQSGSSIAPENIRRGTGGNRLCEECARLNRAAGPVAGPVGDPTGDPGGGGREEDLLRGEAARSKTAGAAYDSLAQPVVRGAGEPRAGRVSEDAVRSAARRGTREALEEKEREEAGGGGLYGSQIDASHILGAAIAELVGTFILVFAGTAVAVGAILSRPTAGGAYDSLAIALAFGLALAVVVASIGHVSGAHVNPAVTLGMAATGKFPWNYAPVYVAAQLVGAVLAALATWLTFGGAGARSEALLAATYPARGVGDLQAFVVEILITFILVFVVMAVATDERAPAAIAPVAVGFALAVGVFIAGPVTGGSVNPARSLGPMLVAGDLTSVWLYVVGPIVGGVLGALLYDRFMAQIEGPG
ncbi:MAG TPA: MIP/aquaporin family protein [Rubrobacteraceae bacterium]|nr:MIP/aquaporin family protein [Rubrobacteraceae bacterium]